MKYEFISNLNPIHKIIEKIDIQDNFDLFWSFLSNRNIGWQHYGRFSPFPKGSVFISDELPILHKAIGLKNNDESILSFIYRKLAQYDLAIHYAKKNYNKNSKSFESILELGICFFLNKNFTQASALFSEAKKINPHSNILQLWESFLNPIDIINALKNLENYLQFNPLILKNTRTNLCVNDLLDYDPANILSCFESSALSFIVGIEIGIVEKIFNNSSFNKNYQQKIFELIKLHRSELIINSSALFNLKKFIDTNHIFLYLSHDDSVKITSEIINIFNEKFMSLDIFNNNIATLGPKTVAQLAELSIDEFQSIVFSDPYLVRDSNTSDYNNRYYSLNKNYHQSKFSSLSNNSLNIFTNSYFNIAEKILTHSIDKNLCNFDIWFDSSFTSGQSKINSHFHTASYDRTYLGTMVWYAIIPKNKNALDGNLLIHQLESNDKYTYTPSENGTVCFPSWLEHETTPVNSSSIRLTLNFDLLSEQIYFPLSFFMSD